MSNIIQSIQVSLLAMGVIFLVLGSLIWVIKGLVHYYPYTAPAAQPSKSKAAPSPAGGSPDGEHIAAIHAALAHHLGKAPQDIHIVNVSSL